MNKTSLVRQTLNELDLTHAKVSVLLSLEQEAVLCGVLL